MNYNGLVEEKYEEYREVAKKRLEEKIKVFKLNYREEYSKLQEYNNLLRMSGMKLVRASMIQSEKREEKLKEVRVEIEELKSNKANILAELGYRDDFLDLKFKCNNCKDTGYIGPKKCECYKSVLVNILMENSSLKDIIERENFSTFKLNYFNEERLDGEEASALDKAKENLKGVTEYIEGFDSSFSPLLFTGNSGTGKSFLTHCIAERLISQGKSVVYRSSGQFMDDLAKIKIHKNNELDSLFKTCDLIIIDDLGAENITDFSVANFFEFLNERLRCEKQIIISTNFSIKELTDCYSERIASRIRGNFKVSKFVGKDIRAIARKNKNK